jgi:hypothetical protein
LTNLGRRRFAAVLFPHLCGWKFILKFLSYATEKIISFGLGGFVVERDELALCR